MPMHTPDDSSVPPPEGYTPHQDGPPSGAVMDRAGGPFRTVSNPLDRFESAVERLFEGGLGKVFRSTVQPAEIGRKLERAMVASTYVSMDATIAPNDFLVAMNPDDLATFAEFLPALTRHLETWLADLAQERRLTLLDRVHVEIVSEDDVPRREIRVAAAFTETDDPDPQPVVGSKPTARLARLRVLNGPQVGQELPLRAPMATIGRASDNDVVLIADDVSRYHARIDIANGEYRLTDLGSTNGTLVNRRPVSFTLLWPGDELQCGSVQLKLVSGEAR